MRRRRVLVGAMLGALGAATVCGCIAEPDDEPEDVEAAAQEFFVEPQPHGFLFRLLPARFLFAPSAASVPIARAANTATADDDSDDDGGP